MLISVPPKKTLKLLRGLYIFKPLFYRKSLPAGNRYSAERVPCKYRAQKAPNGGKARFAYQAALTAIAVFQRLAGPF